MGIDIVAGGRNVNGKRRSAPASDNVYQKLLVKLYRFLSRRTDSKFNAIVLKRMFMSGNNRPPIGLARVARYMRGDAKKGKIAVVVGKVTDDARLINVPKLTVCALTFTEGARARILKAGGECLTFDQLALREPKGNNTVLLRGRLKARKNFRYFGMGEKGAHKRPRVRSQGRKFEKARGRRRSRGFKV